MITQNHGQKYILPKIFCEILDLSLTLRHSAAGTLYLPMLFSRLTPDSRTDNNSSSAELIWKNIPVLAGQSAVETACTTTLQHWLALK